MTWSFREVGGRLQPVQCLAMGCGESERIAVQGKDESGRTADWQISVRDQPRHHVGAFVRDPVTREGIDEIDEGRSGLR